VKSIPVTLASVLALAFYPNTALAAPALATISLFGGRQWLRPILCGLGSIAVFLILRAAIRLGRTAFARGSKRSGDGETPPTSIEHFVADAQKLHIDPQIARETFQLLTGLVPAETSIGVNGELRGSLHLSDGQIDSLLSALPELCDRSGKPANAASVLSVYDLLHHIESSPLSESGRSQSRTSSAATTAATPRTSPLADLQNASPRDSRFRTRAHFSGVKRRASDYSGPYRRATDRRPDENYAGPLRRASDRPIAVSAGADLRPDPRLGDRRSSERRAVVSQEGSDAARQHRAVAADTSLLNQCLNIPSGKTGSELVPTPMTHESIEAVAGILQRS
jgi:hypothetical protein